MASSSQPADPAKDDKLVSVPEVASSFGDSVLLADE
jgi:hypothetical protein